MIPMLCGNWKGCAMRYVSVHLLIVLIVVGFWCPLNHAAEAKRQAKIVFTVHPIGHVQKTEGHTWLVLDKKYQPGLLGLEGFSHIQVIYWFDKNDTPQKRAILQVHPRGDPQNPLTGVFACRAPIRPNLIALGLCKVISVKGNVVEVEKIDAFEGTPVLDIKPYAPGQDSVTGAKVPEWAKPR
jgi:tRNA-Thr(GGU) m(6)t(6)A37 methyltransferase TsaA